MYFSIPEWVRSQEESDDDEINCPYRVFDPMTGCVINGVREFNDDEGWLRVLCRAPRDLRGRENRFYAHPDTGEMVSQILYVPYQVVPYYDGIDDLQSIYIDTMTYDAGRPTGDWLPADQPYHHPSSEKARPMPSPFFKDDVSVKSNRFGLSAMSADPQPAGQPGNVEPTPPAPAPAPAPAP